MGALVLAVVLVAVGALALDTGGAPGHWRDGSDHGRWHVEFSGFGAVTGDDEEVHLRPAAAGSQDPSDTHAALVTTREDHGDLVLRARLRTDEQLRPGEPNPWEVAWLLWHLGDPQHFYAITLKPNGWELSKQVPGAPGGQQFLASGTEPRFPVGDWHEVRVEQRGARIVVEANGQRLVDLTDPAPYTTGAVGLYTEDAAVRFRDVTIEEER